MGEVLPREVRGYCQLLPPHQPLQPLLQLGLGVMSRQPQPFFLVQKKIGSLSSKIGRKSPDLYTVGLKNREQLDEGKMKVSKEAPFS